MNGEEVRGLCHWYHRTPKRTLFTHPQQPVLQHLQFLIMHLFGFILQFVDRIYSFIVRVSRLLPFVFQLLQKYVIETKENVSFE